MILARFRCDIEIGTEKRRAHFGHQFLGGVAMIAPTLATKIAIEASFVPCPVGQFMQGGGANEPGRHFWDRPVFSAQPRAIPTPPGTFVSASRVLAPPSAPALHGVDDGIVEDCQNCLRR